MQVRLHKNATTTPARRAYIQSSPLPLAQLARELGVSLTTVRRWKARDSVEDRSHTAHRLQTTLSAAQEAIVVELRKLLLLPLDDLLVVVREFIHPQASRSGLDRLLRRHGLASLREMKAQAQPPRQSQSFTAYEPGFLHLDGKYLPALADGTPRRYLFVAIDRATRWVFVQVKPHKTAQAATSFLKALEQACPLKIRKILTDNGKEFTDRLFGSRARGASGEHEFDQLCAALGIEHRLIRPGRPQTNGMVERFNARIEEVLPSHHFQRGEELDQTLKRYVWLYNHQLPQKNLQHQSPIQAMKQYYQTHPHLFKKAPINHAGPDTSVVSDD